MTETRYQALVTRSRRSAAVMGRGTDFLLAHLVNGSVLEADAFAAYLQGFKFCGLVCQTDAGIDAEFEDDLESKVLVLRAAHHFETGISSSSDPVSWLENLHRLEDARPLKSSIGCSEGCSESDPSSLAAKSASIGRVAKNDKKSAPSGV